MSQLTDNQNEFLKGLVDAWQNGANIETALYFDGAGIESMPAMLQPDDVKDDYQIYRTDLFEFDELGLVTQVGDTSYQFNRLKIKEYVNNGFKFSEKRYGGDTINIYNASGFVLNHRNNVENSVQIVNSMPLDKGVQEQLTELIRQVSQLIDLTPENSEARVDATDALQTLELALESANEGNTSRASAMMRQFRRTMAGLASMGYDLAMGIAASGIYETLPF